MNVYENQTIKRSFPLFCMTSVLLSWLAHTMVDFFWILLPTFSLFLIFLACRQTKIHFSLCSIYEGLIAIGSGIGLYLLFWIGNQFGNWIFPTYFPEQIQRLYQNLQPESLLSWFLLLMIVIPGEEIIWRATILEKLLTKTTMPLAVLLATMLYMFSLIFSISFLLIIAGLFGGLLWSALYQWRKNMILPLLSHLVFDLLLLLILPFY